MRRALLIILAFVPALAAFILYRSIDGEEKAVVPFARDSDDGAALDEPLAGFSGTGTFYRRLSPMVLDGREIEYPSAYYLMDAWRRDQDESFLIEGLLVIRNERPRSPADLETRLLQVPNSLLPEELRALLERERERYDSLRAGRARASGGRTVADSERFALEGGVAALIPAPQGGGGRLELDCETAEIALPEGRLGAITIPGAFRARHPDYELGGRGLEAREEVREVVIAEAPRVMGRGLSEGERRELAAKGPLVWRPDAGPDGAPLDILERIRFDLGEIEVEHDVLLALDDIELRGRQAQLRLGREDGTLPGRLTSFAISGEVTMTSPRGRVTGERARGTIADDGALAVILEGAPATLVWNGAADADERSFAVTCRGPVTMKLPGRERRDQDPLLLGFDGNVTLELDYRTDPVRLEGENLAVTLLRVPAPDGDGGARPAWRLDEAVLRGRTSGQARGHVVRSPRLAVRRRHDETGLHLDDLIVLEGPVSVVRAGGLGRDDPELETTIEARRRFELLVPASPFADGRAVADGHVRVRERRGRSIERSLDCEHIEVVRGPETIAPGLSRLVLKNLLARDSVTIGDERGSTLKGELVSWRRADRAGRVEGAPARASFLDGLDRRQEIAAATLDFNSASGRLIGSGAVSATLSFPALRLADDREKTDDERVEGRAPVAWQIACAEFRALFTGDLPLGERAEEGEHRRAELVEIDLQGDVIVENPDQKVLAATLHYDLRRGAGQAEGGATDPVRVRARRQLSSGEEAEDWLEAQTLTIEPDWTLLRGRSEALLHVVAEKQEPGRPRRHEELRIECRDDTLLKGTELHFTGPTRLRRGLPGEGGLDLRADSVTADFAAAPDRKSGRGELLRVRGIGGVSFEWRDLEGEGQVVTVDYQERNVVLEAERGSVCSMKRGRGYTARSEVVIYDMDSRKITQTRLRVEKLEDKEKDE